MPKAFNEREKQLIRRRLIQAGYKRFSAYGLNRTNVEELARAAGISKGAFYLFYGSKESLFLDVAEVAEAHFRQELLATVDEPGPSPRLRLLAVFEKAFAVLKTVPILQSLSGSDYELLLRRVPEQMLQKHLESDRVFFEELILRCKRAGVPICVPPDQILRLLYPLVVGALREEDQTPSSYGGSLDLHLELVAAYCLGEVRIEAPGAAHPENDSVGGKRA